MCLVHKFSNKFYCRELVFFVFGGLTISLNYIHMFEDSLEATDFANFSFCHSFVLLFVQCC